MTTSVTRRPLDERADVQPGGVRAFLDADGRLTVHLRLLGTAWLERLLLHVGPDARVVEPPELRDLGARAARRLLAGYR